MDLYEMIRDIPMFKDFTEEEKKQFAKLDLSVLNFPKDYTIIKEGEERSEFYLLIEGTVLVTKANRKFSIAKLGAGAVFGEMAIIAKEPRSTSVITAEDCVVVRLDEDFFHEITPYMEIKIKDYFLDLLISRLNSMNKAVVKLAELAVGRITPESE